MNDEDTLPCCTGCDRFSEEWKLETSGLGLCEGQIHQPVTMHRANVEGYQNCWIGEGSFDCGDHYYISVCCDDSSDQDNPGICMAAQMCDGPVVLDCEVSNLNFGPAPPQFNYKCESNDVSVCDCCPHTSGPTSGGLGQEYPLPTTLPPQTTTPWPPGDCGCLPKQFKQPIWLCNDAPPDEPTDWISLSKVSETCWQGAKNIRGDRITSQVCCVNGVPSIGPVVSSCAGQATVGTPIEVHCDGEPYFIGAPLSFPIDPMVACNYCKGPPPPPPPPPKLGACCVTDTEVGISLTCSPGMTEAACEASGGGLSGVSVAFLPGGSCDGPQGSLCETSTTTPEPEPRGACCVGENCVSGVLASGCRGGSWFEGMDCVPNPCITSSTTSDPATSTWAPTSSTTTTTHDPEDCSQYTNSGECTEHEECYWNGNECVNSCNCLPETWEQNVYMCDDPAKPSMRATFVKTGNIFTVSGSCGGDTISGSYTCIDGEIVPNYDFSYPCRGVITGYLETIVSCDPPSILTRVTTSEDDSACECCRDVTCSSLPSQLTFDIDGLESCWSIPAFPGNVFTLTRSGNQWSYQGIQSPVDRPCVMFQMSFNMTCTTTDDGISLTITIMVVSQIAGPPTPLVVFTGTKTFSTIGELGDPVDIDFQLQHQPNTNPNFSDCPACSSLNISVNVSQ